MEAIIYTKNDCPYCVEAKTILGNLGISYAEKLIQNRDDPIRVELVKKMQLGEGQRLFVPQIWIDDRHINGCDSLKQWATNQDAAA